MAYADLTDISKTGACLQLNRPIPVKSQMRFHYGNQQLTGTARHCVLRETGYVVGMEFDPGCEWREQPIPLERRKLVYARRQASRAAEPAKQR